MSGLTIMAGFTRYIIGPGTPSVEQQSTPLGVPDCSFGLQHPNDFLQLRPPAVVPRTRLSTGSLVLCMIGESECNSRGQRPPGR